MKSLFRQYDIRGIAGTELTDQLMYDIARAFAAMAAKRGLRHLLVGRDNRISSPHLHDVIIKALLDSGCTITDLGEVITPIFYFAARALQIPAGIMITASHNPGEYNGCKLQLGDSTIYGEDIQEIWRMIERREFIDGSGGVVTEIDIAQRYYDWITSHIQLGPHKLKVVVDCGNGTASTFAPELFRRLGCEVIPLYCESDPRFPNHHPDPVKPENMRAMVTVVQQQSADLGIGIDGDGDRIGVVDRSGRMIWGDMLMILYWREILPKYPGCNCIVEVKCSQSLIDEIQKLGGHPMIYKTGHSLIKAKMKEIGAVFTGEMSGHMFFADEYFGFDDALYAGARLLRILSRSEQDIAALLADVKTYYATPEIRIPSSDAAKFTLVEQVQQKFRQQGYELIDIDGARIIFPKGWALVRASNTGPELIFRCEGANLEELAKIKKTMAEALHSLGVTIP